MTIDANPGYTLSMDAADVLAVSDVDHLERIARDLDAEAVNPRPAALLAGLVRMLARGRQFLAALRSLSGMIEASEDRDPLADYIDRDEVMQTIPAALFNTETALNMIESTLVIDVCDTLNRLVEFQP